MYLILGYPKSKELFLRDVYCYNQLKTDEFSKIDSQEECKSNAKTCKLAEHFNGSKLKCVSAGRAVTIFRPPSANFLPDTR